MIDKEYFSHVYEIANHLNKEFSLPSALRKSLEKTVEILGLKTGWIWLTEADNQSVYLACSYNLPPALTKYPERLAGPCYCIQQYLTDDIDQATNISEITCTRLKDVNTGTKGLKFHASIPIIINDQKVGLLNLLSEESRELNEKELTILNTISELIGVAIQRTRLQQSYSDSTRDSHPSTFHVLKRIFLPQIKELIEDLSSSDSNDRKLDRALRSAKEMQEQLLQLQNEIEKHEEIPGKERESIYPKSPLTKRELEVLTQIKIGYTNGQIGEQLYIAERTVKFHVTSILAKLNAKTRTEAVDLALKRGLL